MGFRDLRQAVDVLRSRGRLLEIAEPLSPEYELAAFLAEAGRGEAGAVYFSRVKGYAVSVVGNVVYGREVLGWAMDVAEEAVPEELGRRLGEPLPPKAAAEAPVLETEVPAERAVAEVLPILRHYEADSAPFVTTGLISVVDPRSGETARGIHRMELRGPRRLGVALLNPPVADVYAHCRQRGEPLPAAVAIGVDPLTFASFALKGTAIQEKLSVAGGLRGEPVEVVRAPGTGISVPARAEFLLEGELDPRDEREDGPLGEVGGYSLAFPSTPTLRVDRIFHRADPLYHALLPTGPEGDLLLAVVAEAAAAPRVRTLFPFVQRYHYVPGTFGSSLVVQLSRAPREQIRSALLHLLTLGMVKKAVAVADDVDPADLRQVEWSVATRCQPDADALLLADLKGQPIDPSCTVRFRTSKLALDATGYERLGGRVPASIPPAALERARAHLSRGRTS